MSSTTDKLKGTANRAIGKAKQHLGGAVGSNRLKAEGVVQQAKGHVQQTIGQAKDTFRKVTRA